MKAEVPQKTEFKQLKAGAYVARIYSIVDIGSQETTFNGETKMKRKIRVTWEFPSQLEVFDEAKGEQPFVLANEYTLSLYESAPLRKDIESWLGRPLSPKEMAEGFEVSSLLGTVGQAQVIHIPSKKDPSKSYAQISSLMALPEGMPLPKAYNPQVVVEMEDWDGQKFQELPEFVRKKIEGSKEYREKHSAPEFEQASPDDVPQVKPEPKKKSEIDISDIPF